MSGRISLELLRADSPEQENEIDEEKQDELDPEIEELWEGIISDLESEGL